MEGLVVLLIIGIIVAILSGPIAFIMSCAMSKRLDRIQQRLEQIESRKNRPDELPQTSKVSEITIPSVPLKSSPVTIPSITKEVPKTTIPPVTPAPAVIKPEPAVKAQEVPMMPNNTQMPLAGHVKPQTPPTPITVQIPKPKSKEGLEQKIGITVALIAGVITVIIGVGFFLKYVYENKMFSDFARVCLVAVGGFVSFIIGEIIRRRDYGIVAKGLAALGFALFYASVFSASQVYHLIQPTSALILALCISAGAMAYAVMLNERLIAFMSLLGGYLSPLVIMYHQDMPMPVFSYILSLSIGAMGCAMFRRWRAVNWIAIVGTYLLYTVWFEQFYRPDMMTVSLTWISVFGMIYLLQPILYSVLKKINARAEDVSLIVVNSIAVFYYLCRILYVDYQQQMALAVAGFGVVHLLLMGYILVRCPDDKRLSIVLSLMGTAFITTSIGLYFAKMPPKILGWAVETVVLTFIGIRYKSWPTKIMSYIVAGVSILGMLYHLPLHYKDEFRLILNGPYMTWVFVSVVLFVCHGMWRWMPDIRKEERSFGSQVYYVVASLLLAFGSALEWYDYSDIYTATDSKFQAFFVMGLMLIAAVLLVGLSTRKLAPVGRLVRNVAMITTVIGAIFTGLSVMGIYYTSFRIFINLPFVIECAFVAALFWAAYQFHRSQDENPLQKQFADGAMMIGFILIGVLITGQIYMYWYCLNEYDQPVSNWQISAWHYMTITWVIYGAVMLYAGLRYSKTYMKALSIAATILSIIGLCYSMPLHETSDYRFIFNLPFVMWLCVSAGLILSHAMWRFMPQVKNDESLIPSQLYYVLGIVVFGVGGLLEWYNHCQWHIEPVSIADSNFLQGSVILSAVILLLFFIRSIPPKGEIVRNVGLLIGLAGTVYTVIYMEQVYYRDFMLFMNLPFIFVLCYLASLLAVAAFVKGEKLGQYMLSPLVVLAGMILLWCLLSQQIYQYFKCSNQYAEPIHNWRFSAQMYISLAWAIYAAVLLLIGFFRRAAGIRYLSLVIFTVLLGKINWDIHELPTEYRIATFVTTGLILVGVSFLYQFLRKKGFFETVHGKFPAQTENSFVKLDNPA